MCSTSYHLRDLSRFNYIELLDLTKLFIIHYSIIH